MNSGFEIRDAGGTLIVSVTDRIGRFLGSFDVAAYSTGSLAVPELAGASPFFISVPKAQGDGPYVSFDSANLYWAYNTALYSEPVDATIYYGVY